MTVTICETCGAGEWEDHDHRYPTGWPANGYCEACNEKYYGALMAAGRAQRKKVNDAAWDAITKGNAMAGKASQ